MAARVRKRGAGAGAACLIVARSHLSPRGFSGDLSVSGCCRLCDSTNENMQGERMIVSRALLATFQLHFGTGARGMSTPPVPFNQRKEKPQSRKASEGSSLEGASCLGETTPGESGWRPSADKAVLPPTSEEP